MRSTGMVWMASLTKPRTDFTISRLAKVRKTRRVVKISDSMLLEMVSGTVCEMQ